MLQLSRAKPGNPASLYMYEEVGRGRNEDVEMNVWLQLETDRIREGIIGGTMKMGEVSMKVQERRLEWYGHVVRREEECDNEGKRMMRMDVEGRRRK